MKYQDFLKSKKIVHEHCGFNYTEDSKQLFPFQNHVVKKSLSAGKYGVFSGTGTGKTRMQLTWGQAVADHTKMPVLILAPLAVSGQTIEEGGEIGVSVKRLSEKPVSGVYIINYDQLDNIEQWVSLFGGIALDEASILKNHEGAYRNKLIELFTFTKFKSVWTATPSPNDPMEIGNYSEFLDVMPRNEMLAMYFVHDAGETQKWRLKGHSRHIFWDWVSTWAIMFQKPSDIGFEQDGYDLPKLNLIEKQIITNKRDNGLLFNDVAVSATNFNQELRLTKLERLTQVADIVNNSKETFLIWCKQNEEGEELRRLIPDAVEVKGSDTNEYKEEKLLGFGRGDFRVLITKSKIAGMGLNFQKCHNQIFASPDFSFEAVFQSIRRSWRFGQEHEVNAWVITTDTMTNVIKTMERKQKQFEEMQTEMTKAVNRNIQKKQKMKKEFKGTKNEYFHLMQGDCFDLVKKLESDSVDYSFFSPPFASLYTFSDDVEDLSNVRDVQEFLDHFNFLPSELFRITKEGRLLSMHLTQLTTGIGRDGYLSIVDLRGDIIRLFQSHGWYFHAEVAIWKDPQLAAIRTKNIQLLHGQTKRDSSINRPGLADYIVTFRKPGVNKDPICHNGDGLPFELWTKIASPIWMEISESDTLQFRSAKGEHDERHITPTQLKAIEWSYRLWTNEGDTIFSPFAGIGSELYQAIKMNRKAIGIELKESYYKAAVKNLTDCVQQKKQLTII